MPLHDSPHPSVAIEPMARCLAAYPALLRETPDQAIVLLNREGFGARAILAGVDAALALARTGIAAAASDDPVARAISGARDLAAVAVILIGGGHLWAVLP